MMEITEPVDSEGWRSPTACSSTGPSTGRARSAAATGDSRSPPGGSLSSRAKHGPRALQGPLKLAEVFALLPVVRQHLPEAGSPFAQPRVAVTMGLSAAAVRALRLQPAHARGAGGARRRSPRSCPRPSPFAGRRSPSTTGPSTSRSEATSTASSGEREHERCGSHLVGPLLLTSAVGGLAARRVRGPLQPLARIGAALGAVSAVGRGLRLDAAKPRASGRRARWRDPDTSSSTGS